MGLFDFFKSKNKKSSDELNPDSFFEQIQEKIENLRDKEGTELDELPTSEGEFGFSPNNPIPLSSISDSRAYLEKLIYIKPGASQYTWERAGSLQSKIVSTPVDQYNLLDTESKVVKTIFIWTYNKVNSKKAPEGFGLMDI